MKLKAKHILTAFFFLFQFNMVLLCQTRQVVTGVILDEKTNEGLPYSSLRLKNHSIGTISDTRGYFEFLIPDEFTDDTLAINYIGYEEFFIELSSVKSPLKVKLKPNSIEIEEAVILPLSAEEYLVRAVKRVNQNYPKLPYQTISYYSEELTENNNVLHKQEAVFKTNYANADDTLKNQHQLLLYREPDEVEKFAFMRRWVEKRERKERKKAEKEGSEIEPEVEPEPKIDLGGPETILSFDLTKELPFFLDTNQFKEFKYYIGKRTTYQGKNLITINFHSKGKVEMEEDGNVNIRQEGTILLDLESDAFVMIEHSGKLVIPFAVRPILFAFGLAVKNPVFSQTVKYEPVNDLWYPKDIHWNANVKLVKRHIARAKEKSEIGIAQIFFVSEINTSDFQEIAKEKVFDPDKEMEEQIYNDNNITWQEINILKN